LITMGSEFKVVERTVKPDGTVFLIVEPTGRTVQNPTLFPETQKNTWYRPQYPQSFDITSILLRAFPLGLEAI
jgi:hypothetical protein